MSHSRAVAIEQTVSSVVARPFLMIQFHLFLSTIFGRYFAAVTEALTSAKRTEESLRRLKNVREKPTANNSSSNRSSGGMSDDDKIRLQLHVDIVTWTEEIGRLQIERHSIEKLDELNELAQSCTGVRTERS